MSDAEDEHQYQNQSSDPVQAEVEEETEEVEPQARGKGKQKRNEYDEEEDEEEDEEDEDEDEEEEDARGRKRQKRRHKRSAVNRFLDVEAEVNEDEEDEDEDEEYGRDEFIAEPRGEGEDGDLIRRSVHHARLDRRERELDDQDLARIAEDVSQRYKRSAIRYTGDMNEVPQRLLMPSVNDANLWQVRCKPGRERDLVFSLMRKAIDLEYSKNPLMILSAFQRDTLPGMIYVEARSQKQVSEACNGLVGVYPSRGIVLVPIEEMASLLQIKKQDLTVTPGSWVRIKRGKYQGDLAQVMDITENGEEVGLKFIPRIDLTPKEEMAVDGKKRKKMGMSVSTGMRPPQRFFNYEEVVKHYGRKMVAKRNQVYVFQNDTYKDGFIEKDFRLSALSLENVNPTLDEITRFSKGQEGGESENNVDLSIIAEASRKAAIAVLQPGDHIEVFEGEQSGVHGIVDSISQDVVTLTPIGVDLEGQKMQVPARSVRKRFKPGDHVKVMTGKNADETGLVVSVSDNVVTFLSDMSMQEVSVFSKDLREAAEVGSGTNVVGNYELHDLFNSSQYPFYHLSVLFSGLILVQFANRGVIFKTERDSFRVLDQTGQVRLVQPHQISMRRESHRAIATDSEGHELRINDNVKETEGEGRKGRVLHIHQSFFAFLHNRDIAENGGVFVTRARSLASLAPKGNVLKPGTDLSKMNPALSGGAQTGGMVGSGNIGRGPRDRLIGVAVTIVKGAHKGYIGTIKDTNGPIARVELHTGNKVITVEKDKLYRRNPNGKLEPLESRFGNMGPPPMGGGFGGGGGGGHQPNPYVQGGRQTPSWGKTPNPYANTSRTPAWTASRTPNPYAADGGRTPAWNASSKTPNPYAADGGRTPAWNAASRTPNPYANSSTGGWGGATPKPNAESSNWMSGGSTPGRPNAYDPWESMDDHLTGAPTPASAPTPAPSTSWGPAYTARTPGATFQPMEGLSAATPGISSAPYVPIVDSPFELNKFWLTDTVLKPVRVGMYVKVHGTRGGGDTEEWDGGKYEGREGIVQGVPETASHFSTTANVLFDDQPISVPIFYLVPVPPTRIGDTVVALDGRYKGHALDVRDRGSGSGWVVSEDDNKFEEIPEDRLVKVTKRPAGPPR